MAQLPDENERPARTRSVGEIATRSRQGNTGAAIRALRQQDGPHPRHELDAIADTLAAIAISYPGEDLASARIRDAARSALVLASVGRQGGTPYDGVADRLFRIAVQGNDGGALSALTRLRDRAQSRALLRSVAVSQHKLAFAAVDYVARRTGPEGLAVARELYREKLVTEQYAREVLARVASYHQWD